MNNKDFIQKLKDGDENTWRELIDTLKDKMYKTAFSFVASYDDAEDIVQDVFVEVHKNINNFRADSSISTWIYRITVNKSLNFLKKNKKTIQSSLVSETEIENNNYSAKIHTPSSILQQKETRKMIYQAIGKLPERQAMVFVMHKIDGRSYKEISEILEISVSSVESLMHRAKRSLQKKLIGYAE